MVQTFTKYSSKFKKKEKNIVRKALSKKALSRKIWTLIWKVFRIAKGKKNAFQEGKVAWTRGKRARMVLPHGAG